MQKSKQPDREQRRTSVMGSPAVNGKRKRHRIRIKTEQKPEVSA